MTRKLTQEEFIKKSVLIHGDKYNYNGVVYINACTKVEIYCNTCNTTFEQLPSNHLSGKGCLMCSGSKKLLTEDFINRSILIHGNKYNYNNTDYKNNRTKVEISCNRCNNTFEQLPSNHLDGRGCYCNKKGKYNDVFFERYPEKKNDPSNLYFKKFTNIITNEIFYKIGITINSRYFRKEYVVTTIKELPITLYESYLKEKELLNKFKNLQYEPQLKFNGKTECFTEEILEQEEIIDLFQI